MKIPVTNVYYMLLYSWRRLDEGALIDVGSSEGEELLDLATRVLLSGVNRLFRDGLYRNYVETEDVVRGLKGRVVLTTSMAKTLLQQGKTHCVFDEFTTNVLHNQIIKATLHHLRLVPTLDAENRAKVLVALRRLREVSDIRITPSVFTRAPVHGNNAFYRFVLMVCRFILEDLIADENGSGYRMREFVRDEVKMRKLFQDFVAGVFRHHRKDFLVSTEYSLKWEAEALTPASRGKIPGMRADIVLRAKDSSRVIIIDTKFSGATLEEYQGKKTVKAQDLRQIVTYLETASRTELCAGGIRPEGLLLYPKVDDSPDLDYIIRGFRVSLRTVDLSMPNATQVRTTIEQLPQSLAAVVEAGALAIAA